MENKHESNEINVCEIIFQYKGGIYNRPIGRGIMLKDGEYGRRDVYLDEVIPDGDFEIEIVIRKTSDSPSNSAALIYFRQ